MALLFFSIAGIFVWSAAQIARNFGSYEPEPIPELEIKSIKDFASQVEADRAAFRKKRELRLKEISIQPDGLVPMSSWHIPDPNPDLD